ncbi:hypothetical protein JCM10296v2_004219 [Rhodotorula toruloides]
MPLLLGDSPRHAEAQSGHIVVHQKNTVAGPTGHVTAAAAMQHVLSEVQQQHLDVFGHSVHKDGAEVRSAVWAPFQLSFVDSVDNEIARFKELVRARMNGFIESFNPVLAPALRAARVAVDSPADNSLFVPVASTEENDSLSWTTCLYCHVVDIQPRTAVSLGLVQTTAIRIPHLRIRHPREDCLYIQLHYTNLGAILFFEIRKTWFHLDSACPLRPRHQSRPVAYASLFNLILLGDLRRYGVDHQMCRTDDFPRIACDVLGNSHDDQGQPDFYLEFEGWVIQTFKTPHLRNQMMSDTLAWLRAESPLVASLPLATYNAQLEPKLSAMIAHQLEHVVELLE